MKTRFFSLAAISAVLLCAIPTAHAVMQDDVDRAVTILERYTDWDGGTPPTVLSGAKALLEVAGVEPASSESLSGLLRAQPVGDLGSPLPTGGPRRPQPE